MMILYFVLAAMGVLAPGRDHLENATAITTVLLDERPLFQADESKLRTAALVVAIAFRESSFRNDARSATDDGCMMQLHGRHGLGAEECVRIAMTLLRASMASCPGYPLAVYAEGPRGCSSGRAQRISRDRMAIAARLLREVQP